MLRIALLYNATYIKISLCEILASVQRIFVLWASPLEVIRMIIMSLNALILLLVLFGAACIVFSSVIVKLIKIAVAIGIASIILIIILYIMKNTSII